VNEKSSSRSTRPDQFKHPAKEMMLALFDIDGTVCDTQEVEGRCFAQAFDEVCGLSLETLDWSQYEEPTSSGIVRTLLAGDPDLARKEIELRDRFVQLLSEVQPKFPEDFRPIRGAVEFLSRLSTDPSVTVAFATGGFDTETAFKLRCCGINLSEYPHATSSDTPRRREILPLAAKRAGIDLSSAVYFGDAPWDVKVSGVLNLPMMGIGRRTESLRQLGLRNVFRDFSQSDALLKTFYALVQAE